VLNADATEAAVGVEGELACLKPFPSQPLFFWGDKDHKRYSQFLYWISTIYFFILLVI